MQPEALNGFRLSPQQRRLWLLQTVSTAFRTQCAVVLTGNLDRAALKTAFENLIRRHEILRTTFSQLSGMKFPVQVVNEQSAVSWTEHDLMKLNEEQRVTRTEELGVDELRRPFNFERGPLLHLTLVALGSRQHLLLVTLPSLCADSWTLKSLVQGLAASYHSSDVDENRPLQYAQFAEWQNELLRSNDGEPLERPWAHLPQEWAPPRLPYEINGPAIDEFAPERVEIPVPTEDQAKLLAVAEQYRLPVDEFLLALWHTLIWRLTDGNEVLVGRVLTGRDHETLWETFGPVSKCLPTVVSPTPSLSLSSVVRALTAAARGMIEDQEFFEIDKYQPARNSAGTGHAVRFLPFVFSSQYWPTEFLANDLTFTIRDSYVCSEAFNIMLNVNRTEDSWRAEFFYDSRRFRRADVCYLARLFGTLLASAITNPDASVSELKLLTDTERQQLILASSELEPQEKCLHELFAEQVELSPEALAVVCGEEELRYRELNERANQVARYLWRYGVKPEARVGILLERSAAQVWGMLGVLKAGAAYVPLDVMNPEARVREQLRDGGVEMVLTEQRWAKQLASAGVKVICVDGAEGVELQQESKEALAVPVTAENLAYVIYTSGSTGKPKGVMVSHRSVSSLATALRTSIYQELGKPLQVSVNAPLTFDASVKQWFQLLDGHVLHILKEEVRYDPLALLSYVRQHELQVLDCTPTQLRSLVAAGLLEEQETSLLAVLCGGDQLDDKTWAALTNSTATRFYNLYGPTECTVDTTICFLQPEQSRPTLGWPVTNVQIHLLDRYLNQVPLGVAGEIFIGGEGVSRGYLGRAELTAERFVPDPFSGRSGARLYMTGDMARYFGGVLEFIGRRDHQVKIKGFRIELEEIEGVLKSHEAVRDVVVIAHDDSSQEKQLVAYVAVFGVHAQSASGSDLEGDIRRFLRERLPEFMIPSAFVLLDALPLTGHGKVDRAALPPLDQRPPVAKDYLPPRNATERAIAAIWREVLGVEKIGIHDNFFDLGGQSLLMAQAYNKLKDTLGREYSMIDMFRYPTVSSLAGFLSNEAGPDESITRSRIEKRIDKQQAAFAKQRHISAARRTHE